MVLGFAERYSIEKRDDGVVLLMRQHAHGLRLGALCAVLLFGSWWFGPYGPHSIAPPLVFYWLCSGFFALVLLASLFVAPFYKRDILITDDEVVVETVFSWSKSIKRTGRGRPLRLWVETLVGGGERPLFPYRVHFLDAGGRGFGMGIAAFSRLHFKDGSIGAVCSGIVGPVAFQFLIRWWNEPHLPDDSRMLAAQLHADARKTSPRSLLPVPNWYA